MILHPWTWVIVALSVLLAAFVFWVRRKWRMVGASWIVLLSGLALGALVFVLGNVTERGRLTTAMGWLASPLTEQSLVLHPIDVIGSAMKIWAPFLNPLLMIFAMIGVLSLVSERSSSFKIYLLSWMAISGIGTLFAVTLQTEIWRIWYVQPVWLLAGVGVSSLLGMHNASKPAITLSFEAGKIAAITFISGLAVFFLEPILGASVFYVAAVLPVLSNIGKRSQSVETVFVSTLILFVSVFFLNDALRSLYPLMLNPHNFRPH